MNDDDFCVVFALGAVLGMILALAMINCIDLLPVEQSMQTKCAEIGSELESYDRGDFTCTNGASFDRGILDNQ